MAESSQNSSFIPKRSPAAKPRSTKSASPALLATLSSILFGAVLIASGALAAYQWYLSTQFDAAVVELNKAAESFSEVDLARVVDFDTRLTEANNLFTEHVSINRVLAELARLTVSSVQFTEISLERIDRTTIAVAAKAEAQELGSVLVQRNTYASDELFNNVSFNDLSLNFSGVPENTTIDGNQSNQPDANFVAVTIQFELATDAVLYEGIQNISVTENPVDSFENEPDPLLEDETINDEIDI